MIEDEAGAAPAQRQRGEQQEVGRVARVDDVEVLRAGKPAHEPRGSATSPARTHAGSPTAPPSDGRSG